MAKLNTILQQEYKSKGLVSGAASAVGKKTLEKLDIRNALFGGSGIGSILGRKIFGKGYSATQSTGKSPSAATSPTSVMSESLLQEISTNTQITAKNTLSIPMMARDMNVMRQNIVKLVKLQGGTATNKADMFFSKAGEREAQYENMLNRKSPSKIGDTKKEAPNKSLFGILMGIGPLLIGAITSALGGIKPLLIGLLGGIPKMIGTVLNGIKSVLSIENILKLMGIAQNALAGIFKFAAVVAGNPVFLGLVALTTVGAMLAKLRGDVDDKRARFLELAEEKKKFGSLSAENEKELQSLKTPANQKASREKLGGYDPITNRIENPNASLDDITKLPKDAQVAPPMAPGVARDLLNAGEFDGYTKEQLEAFSQGKNAPTAQLVITKPPTYNPAMDSQAANAATSRSSGGKVQKLDTTKPPNSQAANAATSPTKQPDDISNEISGPESKGNYNVSFGDRELSPGSGRFTNTAKQLTGKSLTDMTLKEVQDYQLTRGANGAVGKYQFMQTTLFGRQGKKGWIPGLVQQEKDIDINTTRFTGDIQERLQKRFLEQNTAFLKSKNIPVTPGNQYMAHYVGTGGTQAVHEAIKNDPNMIVADAMKAKGYPIGNNPDLYKHTVGNFESVLAGRLFNPTAKLKKPENNRGEKLASSSREFANMSVSKPETIVVTPPAPAPIQSSVSSMGGGTITMASVIDDEIARLLFNRQVA